MELPRSQNAMPVLVSFFFVYMESFFKSVIKKHDFLQETEEQVRSKWNALVDD